MFDKFTNFQTLSIEEINKAFLIDLSSISTENLRVLQKRTDEAYETARRAVNKISDAMKMQPYQNAKNGRG